MRNTDQFVLSVISLAFAIKKLLESDHYDESKHKLVQEFTRLKNRVQLHTKNSRKQGNGTKVSGTAENLIINERCFLERL